MLTGPVEPSFPPFRPLPPWWGPDLQTLRNTLAPPPVGLEGRASERVRLPADDRSGDVLLGLLQRPQQPAARPLVVLVHGLGGCEDSVYLRRAAAQLLALGHTALRLNLRGAGPSRATCRQHYHAGRSADLGAALAALDPALLREGVLLVGFSLGANVLLKFLAEQGQRFPIRGAVAVSAPLDLGATSRRLRSARNRVYHAYLLRRIKRQVLAPGGELSPQERRAVVSARDLYAYDDAFVAARHGFRGADDYYARCSATAFLPEVRMPVLLIHALDDPWIPADTYTAYRWSRHPRLYPLLSRGGGHVGFHARDSAAAWHDRCAALFFERL
jgi:predicted alpha/beta-fold hydrolase